jgi:hypothetical protein
MTKNGIGARLISAIEEAVESEQGRGKPAATRRVGRGKTDLARVDATTDEEIAARIASDPDTAPEWTEEGAGRDLNLRQPFSG